MTDKTFTVVSERYEDGQRVFVLREKKDDDVTLGYVRDLSRYYTEGPQQAPSDSLREAEDNLLYRYKRLLDVDGEPWPALTESVLEILYKRRDEPSTRRYGPLTEKDVGDIVTQKLRALGY